MQIFLDAVEKRQYGWFWECPTGVTCHYRHALPPGYVLKSQLAEEAKEKKEEEEKADVEEDKKDKEEENKDKAEEKKELKEEL